MDKKQNVDGTGPRRSTNGENVAEKEAALDKLRQMEWKRNKIESWHLARPSSRDPSFEVKKFNKDEENYFEGTGVAKNKRQGRKPRPDARPPIAPPVPPGFTLSSGPSGSGPPPVNAWSQKRGSSLFHKGGQPEAEEEEDEILQLVKKESMKTLEEDRKRQQERILMMNAHVKPSTLTTSVDKLEVERETEERRGNLDTSSPMNRYVDESCPIERNRRKSSSPSEYSSPPRYSRFDDSDSAEEQPVKQTRKPPRQMKSSTPTPPDKRTADRIRDERYSKATKSDFDDGGRDFSDTADRFSPRGVVTAAPTVENVDQSYNRGMGPIKDQETGFAQPYKTRSMMIPEREDQGYKISGLADSLRSSLTFGDTQGLLESFQRGQPKPDTPCFDDVDLFLHNVMRYEPPSVPPNIVGTPLQAEPDGIFQLDDSPKVLSSAVANIQPEAQKGPNVSNPLEFANTNGQASSPQFSESSSSQSPFGSFGKQSYIDEASPQVSPPANQLPFPYGLTGNQDMGNLANQNMMAQMAAYMRGFVPPAAAIPGVFNPVTGLPQFMPPMMMPTIPGQDMGNPLYQQMAMNNYYAQLALMQSQMRQEQGTFNETPQNPSSISPQAPSQTPPQTLDHPQTPQSTEPQQHFQMPAQNHRLQQSQQMPPLNNQPPQNYQNQQIPQIPQMPQNIPTLQNYPINLNQHIVQHPQMPQNTPILQNYPMNQSQQIPQNPQFPPQIPQNPLPQFTHYQTMLSQTQPQTILNANSDRIVVENQDKRQPNQFPMNNYQQPAQNNVNAAPQPGSGKNQEEIMLRYQQALQTISQLQQEMGGQLPVPVPIAVPVSNLYARMPQYSQAEQPMGHLQSSGHASPASGSPVGDGYDSSESREQAPPPHATEPASNPVHFAQLPDVAPRGRGQGRRL